MLKTQKITIDCTVSQSEGNVVSNMDGEKVMMSIQKGKYFNLGEVGGVIWDIIESPISVNAIISKLVSEYEIDYKECEVEVLAFLEQLKKEDLVHIDY